MSSVIQSWGLTLNHTLFILALILIVIDFFVASDILTHIAYLILAYLIATNIPLHFMYKILIGLLCWFAIIAAHYLLFRKLIQKMINQKIAPDKYRSGSEGLVNMIGEIKEIEQKKMILLEGDLWPIENPDNLQSGQKAKVVEVKEGILNVEPAERNL